MLNQQLGGLTSLMGSKTTSVTNQGATPNRQISLPLWQTRSERGQEEEDGGNNNNNTTEQLQAQSSLEDLTQLSGDGEQEEPKQSKLLQLDGTTTATSHDEFDENSPTPQPPKAATLLSCTINLANTIVGAGMLGLPGAFGGTGWLGGSLLLVAGALFSSHGLYLLAKAASHVNVYPSSFYTVAHAAVPHYTILIDLAVALKCFGVATGYLITIGDCMVDALDHILLPNGNDGSAASNSMFVSLVLSRQFWIVGALVGVLPVSFFQSFDSLKHASAAALIFVFMLAAGIVAYAHDLADPCEGYQDEYECRGDVVPYTNVASTLEKLPIFIFSFTCHQNIFPIVNEIQYRSMKRINTAVFAAIGFAFVVFWIVAVEGYVTYGSNVKGDILLNYPETGKVTVMRICIAFMLTLHYPLQLDPSRRCIMSLIKEVQNVISSRRLRQQSEGHNKITTTTNYPIHQTQTQEQQPYNNTLHEASTLFSNSPVGNRPRQDYKSTAGLGVQEGKTTSLLESSFNDNHDQLNDASDMSSKRAVTAAATTTTTTSSALFYTVTFGFLSLSFATALVVNDLGVVLAMVGATGSTLVSYVLPGLIYVKLHPSSEKWDITKAMAYVQLGVGCLVMPVALYFVLRGASIH